ncbi:MAG: STAS domain-containing protein [Burkholderiales bacterium]
MAFSLFGKKPDKKPEKPPVKARPATAAPGSRAPAAPAPEDEGESLDFTNYVPPAPAASSAPPASAAPSSAPVASTPASSKAAAPVAAPAGLDFASLAAAAAPQKAQAPEPKRAPASVLPDLPGLGASAAKAEKPAEAKKKGAPKPVDSILCIEVDEGDHEVPPAIEEAAVLFANGQVDEAHARIQKALDGEDLGAWKLQAWLMMFDVLQHLGRKQEFEERALDFVVKLERSPPVWADVPPGPKQNPSLRTGGAATVSLTGSLGAQSAAALEQLRKASEKQPKLRLDFGKLQGVEPAGCKLLLATLKYFKTARRDVWLTGEATLIKLLREGAKAGDGSVEASVWLLLLELYQMLGLQNEFEEAAVDYAVTYEVSPPSWEAPPPRPKADPMGESQPVAVQVADDAFHVSGEVAGQSDQLFSELGNYAAAANPVVLDFSTARRVDFVNAGRLLNALEKLQAEGKQLVIRGAGEMIVALFAVMGIPKVARIIPRK